MSLYTNSIKLTGDTESSDTVTGALVVTGGVGVGGAINCNSDIKSDGLVISKGNYDFLNFSPFSTTNETVATGTGLGWITSCLGKDGTVYGFRYLGNGTGVSKFNPDTNLCTVVTVTNSGNMSAPIYVPTINKVILGSANVDTIKCYDPDTDTVSTVHTDTRLENPVGSIYSHQTGKVYFINVSTSALRISVFDPVTDELDTTTYDSTSPVSTFKYSLYGRGAALSTNNKIYWCPRSDTIVPILNLSTGVLDTTTITGISGSFKYDSIISNPYNSFLYCIPENATDVLRIDPESDTITTIFTGITAPSTTACSCLALDGNIYWQTYLDLTKLFRIDTKNELYTEMTMSVASGTGGFTTDSMAVHPNGKMYRLRETKVESLPTSFNIFPVNSMCHVNLSRN